MSLRAEVAALLKPYLPKSWVVVDSHRTVDEQTAPVLRIIQQGIARHPVAPNSKHLVRMTLRLSVAGVALDRAEDRLDAELPDLFLALEKVEGTVSWVGEATKTLGQEDGLNYDVEVTVTANKPTAPPIA